MKGIKVNYKQRSGSTPCWLLNNITVCLFFKSSLIWNFSWLNQGLPGTNYGFVLTNQQVFFLFNVSILKEDTGCIEPWVIHFWVVCGSFELDFKYQLINAGLLLYSAHYTPSLTLSSDFLVCKWLQASSTTRTSTIQTESFLGHPVDLKLWCKVVEITPNILISRYL